MELHAIDMCVCVFSSDDFSGRTPFQVLYTSGCMSYLNETYPPGSRRGGDKTLRHFSSFLLFLFLPHLPPEMVALIFFARKVQPSLALLNGEVKVCVLTSFFSFLSFLLES